MIPENVFSSSKFIERQLSPIGGKKTKLVKFEDAAILSMVLPGRIARETRAKFCEMIQSSIRGEKCFIFDFQEKKDSKKSKFRETLMPIDQTKDPPIPDKHIYMSGSGTISKNVRDCAGPSPCKKQCFMEKSKPFDIPDTVPYDQYEKYVETMKKVIELRKIEFEFRKIESEFEYEHEEKRYERWLRQERAKIQLEKERQEQFKSAFLENERLRSARLTNASVVFTDSNSMPVVSA